MDEQRTDTMMASHGLGSRALGRCTASLYRGGRRAACLAVEAPLAGMVCVWFALVLVVSGGRFEFLFGEV